MHEKSVTLINCDKEPIHIPGAIQSHGVLLAVTEPDLIITQVSNNVAVFFNQSPDEVISKKISVIIGENQTSLLTKILATIISPQKNIPEIYQLRLTIAEQLFDLNIHRSESLLIIEMEPTQIRPDNYIDFIFEHSKYLIENLQNINDLSELFQSTTDQLKNLTGFDRVMVYQFNKDGSGAVIAESREQRLEPFLGLHYPESDIPQQARRLYTLNWLRFITDVNYTPSQIISDKISTSEKSLDLSFSILRSVSPIHIEYLKNMGVQASMSISIIVDEKLWGLIACHHSIPKFLPYELRNICKSVGQILSWKTHSLLQIQDKEQLILRKDYCNELLESISDLENWIESIQKKSEAFLGLADATGAAIHYKDQLHLIGKTPSLENVKVLIRHTSSCINQPIFFTDNIPSIYPEAKSIKDVASGMLAISIIKDSSDFIIWFRPELLRTINWAGDPTKSVTNATSFEKLSPRRSFKLFKEKVSLHSQEWTKVDLQMCKEFKKYVLEIIVTHQTRRAEIAEKLTKKLEEFVNTVCHEIRNPINGILGSLDIMRSHLKEIDQECIKSLAAKPAPFLSQQLESIKTYIAHIETCAKHQTVIADDVLNLAKLEANKLTLQTLSMNFIDVINTAFNMVNSVITEKKIQLTFLKPQAEILMKNDPHRLLQIMLNLLTNAIKFTPSGGSITVSIQITETNIEPLLKIKVKDTGIGMTPEEVKLIFDRFSQANVSISSEYGGSGLGLVISRHLISLMNGKIKVKSTKGVGTIFSVSLPYIPLTEAEEKAFKTPKPETAPLAQAHIARKILIVEDNKLNQLIMQKIVESYHPQCQILIADDGKQAVALCAQEVFDLILIDIEMPVMNGLEATKEIRLQEQQKALTPTPIIGVSGNATEKQIQAALAIGMDDYITKPVQKTKLIAIIKKWQDATAMLTPKQTDISKAEINLPPAASTMELGSSSAKILLKNLPSLKYQPIPGDGHCLYHAVSLYISDGNEKLLRHIVGTHLEQNLEEFREFINLPKDKTIDEYIKDVQAGKEWASHLEIEILMRVLNRPILVILADGSIRNHADLKRFNGEPIFVFYNDYNHYDALLRKNEYSTEEVLDQLTQLNKFSNKKSDFDQELSDIISQIQYALTDSELTTLHKQFQALGAQALILKREDFFLQRGHFYESHGLKVTNITQKKALLALALKDYQTVLALNPFSLKAAEKIELLQSIVHQSTVSYNPQFFSEPSEDTSTPKFSI